MVSGWPTRAEGPHATPEDIAFLNALKDAVRHDDKKFIERHLDHPLIVYHCPHERETRHLVRTRAQFDAEYGKIFTDKVKRTIENQILDDDHLSVFSTGIMIADDDPDHPGDRRYFGGTRIWITPDEVDSRKHIIVYWITYVSEWPTADCGPAPSKK